MKGKMKCLRNWIAMLLLVGLLCSTVPSLQVYAATVDIPTIDGFTTRTPHDAGSGYSQLTYDRVSLAQMKSYEQKLLSNGYTLYDQREIQNGTYTNRFATYVKGEMMIHLNLFAPLTENQFHVIYGPSDKLVPNTQAGSYTAVVTPSVAIVERTHGVLCMVVQLADGSYYVIDGGYGYDPDEPTTLPGKYGDGSGASYTFTRDSKKDMRTLLEYLQDTNRDGKIDSADTRPQVTWMITHADVDHINLPYNFMKTYSSKFDLQAVYYNFPNYSNIGLLDEYIGDAGSLQAGAKNFVNRANTYFPNVKEYIYHTGQTVDLPGCTLEFLYTPEDLYPQDMITPNHTCGIWRFCFDNGKTFLVTGDAEASTNQQATSVLGSYLQSDMMQVIHHGYEGGTTEFYSAVDPELCFWPCLDISLEHDRRQLGTYSGFSFNKVLRNGERTHYTTSATHTVFLHTLRYDANGGTGTAALAGAMCGNNTANEGDTPNGATVAVNTFTAPEGKMFSGWATTPDGAVQYKPGDQIEVKTDTVLYAVWEVATYTVTVVDGSKVIKTETVQIGSDVVLPEPPVKGACTAAWDHNGKNITADTTIQAVYTHQNITHVAAKASTDCQTWDGNIEHWYCSACGSYGLDEELMQQIDPSEIAVVSQHNYEDGVCADCGIKGGTCGDDLIWTLDANGTLTISGTGAMYDYNYDVGDCAPWYKYFLLVKRCEIENGVTTIGDSAFASLFNLTEITIADSVTSMGDAFYLCGDVDHIFYGGTQTQWSGGSSFAYETILHYNMEGYTEIGCATKGVYCSLCKKTIIPGAGEHSYVDGICSACGKRDPAACEHSYPSVCDSVCERCGEVTKPEAGHNIKRTAAKAATCNSDGNIAYWYCTVCDQVWRNSACTERIDLSSVVLPMAHTKLTHIYPEPSTCYEQGNISYWYCAACDQMWLDAARTQKTDLESVTLPLLEAVASIGDVKYSSLEKAVAAANETEEADTITLLKDLEISSQLVIETDMTITADKAVSICVSEDWTGTDGAIKLTGGEFTLTGAAENAKITLVAGKLTTNMIVTVGGDANITNVHLKGNIESTAGTNSTYGINIESAENGATRASTITLKNVDITDQMKGDGIRVAYGKAVVNLDNVTINNIGRYGINTLSKVNIYNTSDPSKALSISNTYDHAIDVNYNKNIGSGSVTSYLNNVPEGTYAIKIDKTTKSTGRGIIVRANAVLNITDVSIQNVMHNGLELLSASASASVSNATIGAEGYCIQTVAKSTLNVSNVTVQKCSDNAVDIKGNRAGEITFSHSYNGGVETVAPTCTGTGVMTYTCSGCGNTRTETINALGHTYVNGICSVCATDTVASIGDVKYGSLEEAVAAARQTPEADTITLLGNVSVSSWIVVNTEVTIVAEKPVTISGAETQTGSMFRVVEGGKLTIQGSEAAPITLMAGVNTTNLVVNNGGDIYLTNVKMVGNASPSYANSNKARGIFNDGGTITVKSSEIANMKGDSIYILRDGVVNLDDVTIINSGRYGIKVKGVLNIYNTQDPDHALTISGSANNAIDIENGGTAECDFGGASQDAELILFIDNLKKDIHVRVGGSQNLTNVSITE